MQGLEEHMGRVRQYLADKYAARERALTLCREAIRHSANSIRAVHRGEYDKAEDLKSQARDRLDEVRKALVGHPDVFFAGFLSDAEKEYVEASATFAIIAGQPLPDPDALGTSYVAYLHGLGETVGELRRQQHERQA